MTLRKTESVMAQVTGTKRLDDDDDDMTMNIEIHTYIERGRGRKREGEGGLFFKNSVIASFSPNRQQPKELSVTLCSSSSRQKVRRASCLDWRGAT
jgi:hypothetical protein